MQPDAYAAWRAVLVCSGDPAVADAVAGTAPRRPTGDHAADVIQLLSDTERRQRAEATIAVIDFTAVDGLTARHRRTLDRMMDLEPADRRLVAAHHVAAIPVDRLEPLLPGIRQRLADLEHVLDWDPPTELAQLSGLRPSEAPDVGRSSRWVAPSVAALLAITAVAAALAWPGAVATEEVAPPATTTTTSPPATTVPPDLTELVTDPDRDIDLEMTPEFEIVRRLPTTGEAIWTAGPFRDAELLSVELDTVVFRQGSHRLKLSLVDGTLLPP